MTDKIKAIVEGTTGKGTAHQDGGYVVSFYDEQDKESITKVGKTKDGLDTAPLRVSVEFRSPAEAESWLDSLVTILLPYIESGDQGSREGVKEEVAGSHLMPKELKETPPATKEAPVDTKDSPPAKPVAKEASVGEAEVEADETQLPENHDQPLEGVDDIFDDHGFFQDGDTVPEYRDEEIVESDSFAFLKADKAASLKDDVTLPLEDIEKLMNVDLESPSDQPLPQETVIEDLYKFDEGDQEGLFVFPEEDKREDGERPDDENIIDVEVVEDDNPETPQD